MYRDFTEEEKTKLLGYVQDDHYASIWEGYFNFFTDIDQYYDVDISDYIDDIDDYHKNLIAAEDFTSKKINDIFNAVHDVDCDTHLDVDIVKNLMKSVKNTLSNLKTKIEIGDWKGTEKPLALQTEKYTEDIKNEVIFYDVKTCAELYDAYRDGDIKKVQEQLNKEVEELSRDVRSFGDESDMSEKKQKEEMIVDFYRLLDPDTANKFDELFDSCKKAENFDDKIFHSIGKIISGDESTEKAISDFHRYNIMYLAYTAEEPYRSLYLNSLGTYKLGEFGEAVKTSCFNPRNNVINLDPCGTLLHDSNGAYYTFFHESGHAIDLNVCKKERKYFFESLKGEQYSNVYDSGRNYELICGEVEDRIRSEIADYIDNNFKIISLDKEKRNSYIDNIYACIFDYEGDDSKLSIPYERLIYRAVIEKMYLDLTAKGTSTPSGATSYNYNCPSDIYGAVTDGVVKGHGSHDSFTDFDKDGVWDDGEGYWYKEKDAPGTKRTSTGNIEHEAWAEFFGSSIIGNETSLDCMREYLPKTYEQFEKMANDMKDSTLK